MILHINTSKTWRGGEQQLYYLARGLFQKKINELIICQPESELEKKCIEASIPFISIKMRNELDFKAINAIKEIIPKYNIKLIHTHTAKAHAIGLLVKRKFPELMLVVSRRVDFHIGKNPLSKLKYRSKLNDIFLTVSNKIRQVLIEDGISSDKIVTVYSGIDLQRFKKMPSAESLRKEFKLNKKTIIIGNVAALVDHKDQKTLITAVSLMKTKEPFVLMILGEGELETKLKNLALTLGIQNKIIFTGFRKDITAFYNLFNIFTLTSKEEGLGTSVLDAMASGLPIVATRGGGISEMIINGNGAFLTEVGDAENIGTALDKLVEDETLRKSFGEENLKLVKRFSIDETIKKTLLVYHSFLGNEINIKEQEMNERTYITTPPRKNAK